MATSKTVKVREGEKLDDATIERVIELLNAEKPCTKKDACSILNISYNTTRLQSIIDKYKERKTYKATRRAALRGKPASPTEVTFVIEGYLEGRTVQALSESLYRSAQFVNNILHIYSVPQRSRSQSYFTPALIPDEAVRETFKVGETVYSARYESVAKIEGELMPGVYRVWLLSDKWKQYAYQPAHELASLEHLKSLGVNL